MNALFATLRDDVLTHLRERHSMPDEVIDWMRELCDYTVPGGKLNRGLTVLHTARILRSGALSASDARLAMVLGWCIEWLQAFFLVADDLMDQSHTRRGHPCWFRRPEVGLNAANDSLLLQSCIYVLLDKYMSSHAGYAQAVRLFTEVTLQTELGQLLDMRSTPPNEPLDLDRFTPQRHRDIVRYKTAFYSFYLPLALGMLVAGMADAASLSRAEQVSLVMGEYFQVQDDFLDCYGAPEVIGKVGTDIQDAKCSWLVVQALRKASDEQRAQLKAHYGKDTDEDVAKIKSLYRALSLEAEYRAYEERSYAELTAMLDAEPLPALKTAFGALLAKIYKRDK